MKLSGLVILTFLLFPLTGVANHQIICPEPTVDYLQCITGKSLLNIEDIKQSCTLPQWRYDSILYIDMSMPGDGYQEIVRDALENYAVVLLDNRHAMTAPLSDFSKKMVETIGVGVESPFVIYTQRTESPSIILANSLSEVAQRLGNLEHELPFFIVRGPVAYFPGKNLNIRIRREHITCPLYASTDLNKIIDYCDGDASIDLLVNVAMMRSVEAPDPEGAGNTPDAKFVRFSISRDKGGAGIHLRDELIQENVWYQTNVNRHTRFGPYAQSYSFSITPQGDSSDAATGKILFSKPLNENPEYKMEESSSLSIGINASVSAEVGAEGPKVGGELGGSIGVSNTRSLSWDTREYRIRNTTSLEHFSVIWERGLDDCREFVGGKCVTTNGFVYGGPVFDESKFNPIAYANFVPNFDVVYQAEPDAQGITTYRILAELVAKARYGRVSPDLFFGWYQSGGYSTISRSEGYNVKIDWDHPAFEPDINVRLRSMRLDSLCLQGGNGAVYGVTCSDLDLNQKWGLDSRERYRNRGNRGQCLGVKPDASIYLGECNDNLSQKWYWQEDKLISRFSNTDDRWFLALDDESRIITVKESELDNYSHSWRNELTNIF